MKAKRVFIIAFFAIFCMAIFVGHGETNEAIAIINNFSQLQDAVDGKFQLIEIQSDIQINETLYFTKNVSIVATENATLTRAEGFDGPMMVVGENANNDVFVNITVSLKAEEGKTLIVDGNKDLVASKSSAVVIASSSVFNVESGVVFQNHKLDSNEFMKNRNYNISTDTDEIGGACISCVFGTLNIKGGTFENNESSLVEADGAYSGGAIFNYSTVNVYDGKFENNKAARGGAIFNARKLNVYGGVFENNFASVYGGAFYLTNSQYSNLIISQNPLHNDGTQTFVLFKENKATKSGGTIFGQPQSAISIGELCNPDSFKAKFDGNISEGGNGGAINMPGALRIQNAEFVNNKGLGSSSKGGAVYAYISDNQYPAREVVVQNCVFDGNVAKNGGAIALSVGSFVTLRGACLNLKDTVLTNNTATSNGGAIYLTDMAHATIESISASNNTATTNGGFLYISGKAKAVLKNVSCSENVAAKGTVYLTSNDTELTILSGNFADNDSADNNDIYQHSKSGKYYGTLYIDLSKFIHDKNIVGDINEVED